MIETKERHTALDDKLLFSLVESVAERDKVVNLVEKRRVSMVRNGCFCLFAMYSVMFDDEDDSNSNPKHFYRNAYATQDETEGIGRGGEH